MSSSVLWSTFEGDGIHGWAVYLVADSVGTEREYTVEWSGHPDWQEAFRRLAASEYGLDVKLEPPF